MALYPPIVASSMPAFAGSEVRIYFTLSDYNNINEIAEVHATVRRQSSNVNVLNSSSEIKSYNFNGSQVRQDELIHNRYYIVIKTEDIINGFESNVLYKVQLRFSSVSNSGQQDNFFTDNINDFSQWSTVCIIKKINSPRFYIDEFTAQDERDQVIDIALQSNNFYYNTFADFNIIYQSTYIKDKVYIQSETLNKYKIQLFDQQNNLLASSEDLLSSAYNYTANTNSVVISCSLPYQFKNNTDYKVKLTIETRNGYIESKVYNFTTQFQLYDPLDAELTAAVNEEEGYIKIKAIVKQNYIGNLVIRRSDAKGNFLNWRDIKHYLGNGQFNQEFEYYDFTAESGMVYRYLIQKRDQHGVRGTPVYISFNGESSFESVPGIMGEWQHAFLLQSNNGNLQETKQLKLKFDFQLNTYKYNILESKTDTLGSKYPFIKRNGDNYYRSFGCSGTITGYMDQAELFISKKELYYNQTDVYNNFDGDINNYTNQYNYTYERRFREEVEKFLYDSKPKLYKSMQEGNMIIKLMDISLTPKTQLGRLVYNFSAGGYEIDENDVQALIKYEFIKPGVYNTELINQKDTIGRLSGYKSNSSYADLDHPILNKFRAGENILGTSSSLNNAVSASAAGSIASNIKYQQSFNNKIVNDFKIDWLRITIEDDPYLIIKGNNGYMPDDGSISTAQQNSNLYFFKEKPKRNETYIGTLIYFNGTPIVISPPNNIYEFSDVTLTPRDSITFAKDTAAIVDYHIVYNEVQDKTSHPSKQRYDRVNGCLQGVYKDVDIVSVLVTKYRFSNNETRKQNQSRIQRALNGVNTILIDTQPGAVVSISTNKMMNQNGQPYYSDFVVNFTGQLSIDFIDQPDTYITSYKILGKDNKPVEALVYYCATVRREYY